MVAEWATELDHERFDWTLLFERYHYSRNRFADAFAKPFSSAVGDWLMKS